MPIIFRRLLAMGAVALLLGCGSSAPDPAKQEDATSATDDSNSGDVQEPTTDSGSSETTDSGIPPATDSGTSPATDSGTSLATDPGTSETTDSGTPPATDGETLLENALDVRFVAKEFLAAVVVRPARVLKASVLQDEDLQGLLNKTFTADGEDPWQKMDPRKIERIMVLGSLDSSKIDDPNDLLAAQEAAGFGVIVEFTEEAALAAIKEQFLKELEPEQVEFEGL
ncbi:MAG: hypothetical protein N2C14_02065, partial [Planctomycetales bacterium]